MWAPVYDEEWDGDVPSGHQRPERPATQPITPLEEDCERDIVMFKGDKLPWGVGKYEVCFPSQFRCAALLIGLC